MSFLDDAEIIKPIIVAKQNKRLDHFSSVFNKILMAAFIPVFLFGVFAFSHVDEYVIWDSSISEFLYKHAAMVTVISIVFGILAGGVFHEFCHGCASRAYGGNEIIYGVIIGLRPGSYMQDNEKNINSRLQKVQVLAAGIEGNILFAGTMLLLAWIFPYLQTPFFLIGMSDLLLGGLNLLPIDGTDGLRMIMLILGLKGESLGRVKRTLRKKKSRYRVGARTPSNISAFLLAFRMLAFFDDICLIMVLLNILAFLQDGLL